MLNKVILMGRLTRDPEVRYTTNTNALVCSFSLAVNRRFKTEGQPDADFINIVSWGKTAEFCSKYFTKGQQVSVIGRMQTRNYDDKDGKKVYVTEVVAEEVEFVGARVNNDDSIDAGDTKPQGGTTVLKPIEDDTLPF